MAAARRRLANVTVAEPGASPADASDAGRWSLLSDPGIDLPAALSGAVRPEHIFSAVEDLDQVMAAFHRWEHAVALSLTRLVAGAAADPVPPPWDQELWAGGKHRAVLNNSTLLADLDRHIVLLQKTAATLLVGAAAGLPTVPDQYLQLQQQTERFTAGLRTLFAEIWNLLANIDPMTGLGNRTAMVRRLVIELERYQRSQQPCCVAVLDLDDFKPINDSYGHPTGDRVLRSIASLLAAGIRPYDDVFRYGGDEFVLCLPNSDLRTAWGVVERLRLKVAGWSIPVRDDCRLRTTVSIGVASLTPDRGADAALERADQALYVAKRNGRNAICVSATER
jgi:diguanylate cyclase (GGDEF)-like protein